MTLASMAEALDRVRPAGAIGAFAIPTRDALLPVVAPKGGLPRAVALATALQFGGQLLGIACASTAGFHQGSMCMT